MRTGGMATDIKNKYGRLTVLSFSHTGKNYNKYYACRCKCGNKKTVRLTHLKYGTVRSCGCLSRERLFQANRSRRMPFIERAKNLLYSYFKHEAFRKKTPFKLSRLQCYRLSMKECFYCGRKPSNVFRVLYEKDKRFIRARVFKYHGLDRIQNKKGYVKRNVVSCCKHCNLAKRALSQSAFFKLVKLIYENHGL